MPFDPNEYLKKQNAQINSIYNAQKNAQIASLNQAKNKALGEQNAQKKALEPQYLGLRNQVDVTNNQNNAALKEMMAANGLSRSGENVTATSNLYGQRLNSLNALNLQKQQETDAINRKISEINDPNALNAAIAEIEAQRAQALLNSGNRAEDYGLQREQFDLNKSDTLFNQGMANKQYDLSKTNSLFNNQLNRDQYDLSKSNSIFDNNLRSQQFGQDKSTQNLNNQLLQVQIQQAQKNLSKPVTSSGSAAYQAPSVTPSQSELSTMASSGYVWDSSKNTFVYVGAPAKPKTGTGVKGSRSGAVNNNSSSNPTSSMSWKMKNIGY